MRNRLTNLLARLARLAPLAMLAGCATDPAESSSTEAHALSADNGISLNGISLNGISLNGISLNGISLNGISLNGISLNGISLHGVSFDGSALRGSGFHGAEFAGAQLTAQLSNGKQVELRIDDIAPLADANADVLAYAVSLRVDRGWLPLCGHESDGSVRRALAVPGTWDLATGAWSEAGGAFSFACRKASLAKCVELGYKPWLGYADHLRACVRMLRADYCGDGTPHTVTGTPINLYDNARVQVDTESWPVDAEWGPDGALCVHHTRGAAPPACYVEKYSATCGSFASGALLIDEYDGP